MPKYRYQAVDQQGHVHKGTVEMRTEDQVYAHLRAEDLWVTKLDDLGKSWLYRDIVLFRPRVKSEYFVTFCRQLSTMVHAGLNLIDAVKILSEQTESKALRLVLRKVAKEMETGTSFSQAAEAHPFVFSTIFVHMVQAGEASGTLDDMLERVAVFYEKEHNTKEKVKSAMVYPAIVGVISVLVVAFMMVAIIPNYMRNFEAMGIELPLATQMVIGISRWVQTYGYVLLMLLVLPFVMRWIASKNPKLAYWIDYYKLKTPVFGKLWHKQAVARFSRTFSTLFASAIPVLQSMTITSQIVGNRAISQTMLDARERLHSGGHMADEFRKTRLFPPMVTHMIEIGEKTGTLEQMLSKVADFYEADVETMTDRLKTLLEPLMILVLSVIVGGIVVSILLPMFSMMEGV